MLYDNGSIQEQASKKEQDSIDAQKFRKLDQDMKQEQAVASGINRYVERANAQRQEMENYERELAFQQAKAAGQIDNVSSFASPSSNQAFGDQDVARLLGDLGVDKSYEERKEMQNKSPYLGHLSDAVSKNEYKRFSKIFGDNNEMGMDEVEINNAYSLMKSNKQWTDEEIRNMALNREER